jgi:hypothetical protein
VKTRNKVNVYLTGGLGNQIFQLVAGVHFAEKLEKQIILNKTFVARSHSRFDISSFQLPFEIVEEKNLLLLTKFFPRVRNAIDWRLNHKRSHLLDGGLMANEDFYRTKKIKSMSGYFQDLHYFSGINKDFLLLRNPSNSFLNLNSRLSKKKKLSFHVRRGDFIGQKDSHGCLASDWYLESIEKCLNLNSDIDVIIAFTDDAAWVRNQILSKLKTSVEVLVISNEDLDDPAESWTLMRDSNFIICANSTFSITAAMFSDAQITLPNPLTKNENFKDIVSSVPISWNLSNTIWE